MEHEPSSTVPLPPRTVHFVHELRNHLASICAAASMLRKAADKNAVVPQISDGIASHVQQIITELDAFIGEQLATQRLDEPSRPAPPEAPLKC